MSTALSRFIVRIVLLAVLVTLLLPVAPVGSAAQAPSVAVAAQDAVRRRERGHVCPHRDGHAHAHTDRHHHPHPDRHPHAHSAAAS